MNDPNQQSGTSPTSKAVSSADFSLENHGSIFLLRPQTVSARVWIDDHIEEDNGYQPYYPTVVVEHRYIGDIVEGIVADGLVLA